MSALPALAVSGSDLCGGAPFSCCLRTQDGQFPRGPAAGERGDVAGLARDLLAAHGVAPEDLAELYVDLGPGSYTGLRVAITFVRFLQHFGRVAVRACDSLALLASAAPPAAGRLRPLLDARRGRFHCAALREVDGVLRHEGEPAALPFDEVAASIAPTDTFVVPPTLAAPHVDALRARGAGVVTVRGLTAAQLFSPRLVVPRCAPDALEPRYLMASYAEPRADGGA